MARPIDADAVKFSISGLRYIDPNDYFALAEYFMKQVKAMPTLTPPNEWVKAMEAINNAAVAYIEGGPYENDLPGMELALKIDRLSRDFVRPPEGEGDT